MPDPTPAAARLEVLDHALARVLLTRLRDETTGHADFRRVVGDLAGLLASEALRRAPTRQVPVRTAYESTVGHALARPVTIVPILRAGLGMAEGVLRLLPEATVGHVGVYRQEDSLEPVPYYAKFPPQVAEHQVLLVDPMLATGGSAVHAAAVTARLPRDHLPVPVAAPEGVKRFHAKHPDVPILTAALDRELSSAGRILPGLGDAGDRIYGTEGAPVQG
jgi:uracil phosphoribosyltransferase